MNAPSKTVLFASVESDKAAAFFNTTKFFDRFRDRLRAFAIACWVVKDKWPGVGAQILLRRTA